MVVAKWIKLCVALEREEVEGGGLLLILAASQGRVTDKHRYLLHLYIREVSAI